MPALFYAVCECVNAWAHSIRLKCTDDVVVMLQEDIYIQRRAREGLSHEVPGSFAGPLRSLPPTGEPRLWFILMSEILVGCF